MAGISNKGKFSGIVFSKLTLIVLLILCAFMAVSVVKRYTVERDMAERRYGVESEFHELEVRRDALLDKVEYLKGDSGRESEIRKHFDVAQKGEKVVIIVDDEKGSEPIKFTEGIDPGVADAAPWWQFWR